MIKPGDIDFWIKNNRNVLFEGKHGVGKTALISQGFERNGLKWLYFSGATLDPWVDFVGVPKEKTDENGRTWLDLVRPRHFEYDEVEAIFMDELNRTSKKVRNALMELIQFKSINGKKMNNLRMVWGAVNPDDDEDEKYDVEPMDPAQLDRFQIQIDIPYNVDAKYFMDKYGENGEVAVNWWREQEDKAKNLVSPRRLDYAIQEFEDRGDIRHVLPKGVNIQKLTLELNTGSISKKMKRIFESDNLEAAREFVKNENNYAAAIQYIIKDSKYTDFFVPVMPDEKIIGLMSKHEKVRDLVLNNYENHEELIKNLANAGTSKISALAKKIVQANLTKVAQKKPSTAPVAGGNVYFNSASNEHNLKSSMAIEAFSTTNAFYKKKTYDFFLKNLPKDMDIDSAKKALGLLNDVAQNSQASNVKMTMTHLIPMMNHIITFLKNMGVAAPLSEGDVLTLATRFGDEFVMKPKSKMGENEDFTAWKSTTDKNGK